MIRGTLTLLSRSIRGDALQEQAHWLRLASVVVLLFVLVAAHLRSSDLAAPGIEFFRSIAYLGIALISLAGIGHFANAITEEREEGTLGLLLLADISPLAILLGKSTNRVFSTVLIFAAQFPFALLSLTLGGVTVLQILSTFLTLGAYLFLIANMALLASVLARRSSEASALMLLFTTSLLGLIPAVLRSINQLIALGLIVPGGNDLARLGWWKSFYEQTSVIAEVGRIFEPTYSGHILSRQLLLSLILGMVCFLMAWLRFRTVVWASDVAEPSRFLSPRKRRRFSFLTNRPWQAAIAWKDYHFVGGGLTLLALKLLLFPLGIGLSVYYSAKIQHFTTVPGIQFARDALLLILVVEVLLMSSRFFHTERRLGTLPTLLMLPQSVEKISLSKLWGCLLAIVPTVIALLIVEYEVAQFRSMAAVVASREMAVGACLLIVLSQFTVLCSLITKWGALPLAIGIMLITGMILGPFVVAATEFISEANQGVLAELSPLFYATGILSAGIQVETSRRLRLLAGS